MKHLAGGRHELPAVGDWVALRVDSGRARAVRSAAILPRHSAFSAKGGGPRDRGAGRRRQHRRRVPRVRPRHAAEAARDRALPRRGRPERRAAGRRAEQVRRHRRRRRRPSPRRRRRPASVPVHAVSLDAPGSAFDALERVSRAGPDAGAARAVGGGEVVARQSARRTRAAGHRRRARVGRARPAHQRASAARGARGGRADHRHARHARAAALGRGRASATRSRTSPASARAAGSATAGTTASPAARSRRRSKRGDARRRPLRELSQAAQEQAAIEQQRDERALLDAKRQAKIGSKALKALQKAARAL